jgi:predicted NAD-dependent protein-ADP-ribosyltransferase YbiA (DUF1768 family)
MAFFSLGEDKPEIEPGPLSHWLEDFEYNYDNTAMDIGSGNTYPANALSNFAPHPFEIDGVPCNSMEGFLQSLKFESKEMQEYVCTLVGYAAKKKGRNKNWKQPQILYWREIPIKRDSREYQDLLDHAYTELYKNTKFKAALEASGKAVLTHSMGKSKKSETVLTTREFCSRLTKLRDNGTLQEPKNKKLL